jgi:ribonuclease HI
MGRNKHLSSTDLCGPSQERDWVKDRKFKPRELYGQDIDLDDVEICYDDWTYVACYRADPCEYCGGLAAHTDCIVIAVDGACSNNGKANARAAAGVFVGDKSKYNASFALSMTEPTNQKAELRAGICGLEKAHLIQKNGVGGSKLNQVIIKADSEYLVKGMTEWMFKWEKNGYRTSRDTPVTNASLFKRLEQLVTELNKLNVEVLFWHVPRERNQEADTWANMALRSN